MSFQAVIGVSQRKRLKPIWPEGIVSKIREKKRDEKKMDDGACCMPS